MWFKKSEGCRGEIRNIGIAMLKLNDIGSYHFIVIDSDGWFQRNNSNFFRSDLR